MSNFKLGNIYIYIYIYICVRARARVCAISFLLLLFFYEIYTSCSQLMNRFSFLKQYCIPLKVSNNIVNFFGSDNIVNLINIHETLKKTRASHMLESSF